METTLLKGHATRWVGAIMISQNLAKFDGHRQCGSGNLFLVVEQHDSLCSGLNPPLLFISTAHGIFLKFYNKEKTNKKTWQYVQ